MRRLIKFYLLVVICFCFSCTDSDRADYVVPIRWIDTATPHNILPENSNVEVSELQWKLDFSDEFNDAQIDFNKWTINNDTKTRSPRPALGIKEWYHKPGFVSEINTESGGMLVLEAKKIGSDMMYCGSVNSRGKYYMKYGYAEARIKVADIGKSVHTAFWLQSPDVGKVDGTGNDGSEIDVFESAFMDDKTASTIHIDGYEKPHHQENSKRYPAIGLHDGYHVWGMLWTETQIKIYYDGKLKAEFTVGNGEEKWISRAKEYLQLSTGASWANEGDFQGQPANSHLTNAYVDYIRVWVLGGKQ